MSSSSRSAVLRRRTAAKDYDNRAGLNMTPMVDVVMVILIFFMASAAMLGPEWLVATRVPKKGGVSSLPMSEQPLRIAIALERGSDGKTIYRAGDNVFAANEALASVLRLMNGRAANDVVVLIAPASDVAYEDVVIVHAACMQLGIAKVGLAGEEKK